MWAEREELSQGTRNLKVGGEQGSSEGDRKKAASGAGRRPGGSEFLEAAGRCFERSAVSGAPESM